MKWLLIRQVTGSNLPPKDSSPREGLVIIQPKPLEIIIEIEIVIVHFLFYMKLHTLCFESQLIQLKGKGL